MRFILSSLVEYIEVHYNCYAQFVLFAHFDLEMLFQTVRTVCILTVQEVSVNIVVKCNI